MNDEYEIHTQRVVIPLLIHSFLYFGLSNILHMLGRTFQNRTPNTELRTIVEFILKNEIFSIRKICNYENISVISSICMCAFGKNLMAEW